MFGALKDSNLIPHLKHKSVSIQPPWMHNQRHLVRAYKIPSCLPWSVSNVSEKHKPFLSHMTRGEGELSEGCSWGESLEIGERNEESARKEDLGEKSFL